MALRHMPKGDGLKQGLLLGVLCAIVFAASLTDAATVCVPLRDEHGHILRSPAQVRLFKQTHPCPATGNTTGKCPGYVVDHIHALCVCGKDRPVNMQWQTIADAKKKDRIECKIVK